MNDPQAWTTVWESSVGVGGGMGGGGQQGKKWDFNRITLKNHLKIKEAKKRKKITLSCWRKKKMFILGHGT